MNSKMKNEAAALNPARGWTRNEEAEQTILHVGFSIALYLFLKRVFTEKDPYAERDLTQETAEKQESFLREVEDQIGRIRELCLN